MKTRAYIEPTLADTNNASAEHHIADELVVIDWNAALPRRPGDTRTRTQPVVRPLPMTYTPSPQPAAKPQKQPTGIGRGIVWAAAIVTFGPILAGIAIFITVLTLNGFRWF